MSCRPQFGEPQAGRDHPDRPAAFGVAEREGEIALVQVQKPGFAPWFDLPGGALDADEDGAEAVVREFAEETGLIVVARDAFTEADQYFVNTEGRAFNNRAAFFEVGVKGVEPGLKIEDDHMLVWMPPAAALTALRHDAHAWAVTAWLRWKNGGQPTLPAER